MIIWLRDYRPITSHERDKPLRRCTKICTLIQVMLGGMTDHLDEILRCRQLLMIASGSSYHSALANQVSFNEVMYSVSWDVSALTLSTFPLPSGADS